MAPASWTRIGKISWISALDHPCTLITKLGPRRRHLFWNSLLPTQCFIVCCCWQEQKQTKHVQWVIYGTVSIYTTQRQMVGWMMNLKGFGRKRLSWPNRSTFPAFDCRDWENPRRTCRVSRPRFEPSTPEHEHYRYAILFIIVMKRCNLVSAPKCVRP
jgi:hypothetical protein